MMSQSKRKSSSRRKRKLKSKLDDFSKGLGLSPLRILLAAVLLGAVGLLIFYIGFIQNASSDRVAADELSPEALTEQQLIIDDRLETILNQPNSIDSNFLLSINELQDIETEISDLEASSSLTNEQTQMVARIRMKTKSVKVLQMLKNSISCDAERADLIRFCETHVDSDDTSIRRESRYMLCSLPTLDFSLNPSQETFQLYADAIVGYEDCYLESPVKSRSLGMILKEMLQKHGGRLEIVKQGIQLLSTQLQKSEIESIRDDGTQLALIENFGEFQLPSLAYRIAWSEPAAPAHLDGAIEALAKHPDADLSIWLMVIRAQEGFLATNQVEKVGAAWTKLWALSDEIPDEDTKKEVQIKLQRQKHRVVSIGTTFDVSGTRLEDGKPNDFSKAKYVAIVFCDKKEQSINLVKSIANLNGTGPYNFFSVIAFNEKFDPEAEAQYKPREHAAVASSESARKYFEAMLVDVMPYIVLVDESGKIIAANLQFDQIKNRISKLESEKRQLELLSQEPIEK